VYLNELEYLLSLQESYFDNLKKMGSLLENSGEPRKAFDIYQKGLRIATNAEVELSYTMLGLLD
jgi:hypothetical protein